MPPDLTSVSLVTGEELCGAPKRERGRPPVEINLEIVERAASIGCTREEIAAMCGTTRQTLYNHMQTDPEIQAAIDRGMDRGKATLRRMQWKGAEDGNATVLIWLGKQMLGQRDDRGLQNLDKDGNPTDPPSVVVYRWDTPPTE
jgi:hypothetical protein